VKGEKFKTVDDYLAALPKNVSGKLEGLRKTIRQAAPEAEEVISYNMPAYRFHGMLLYFAAHTEHTGFYPGSRTVQKNFRNELTDYETSAGTIRFPYNKPIPLGLVKKIVKYRVKENLEKARLKIKNKKSKV
jgi:uncharacterized protein YdhG (YjbR/CyaY superfamily)